MAKLLETWRAPLDASALHALRTVCAECQGQVKEEIYAQVLGEWRNVPLVAKEIVFLHALSMYRTVGDAVASADDPVLGPRASKVAKDAFYENLSVLCERHVLEQLTDEEFTAEALGIYQKLCAGMQHTQTPAHLYSGASKA